MELMRDTSKPFVSIRYTYTTVLSLLLVVVLVLLNSNCILAQIDQDGQNLFVFDNSIQLNCNNLDQTQFETDVETLCSDLYRLLI
jgi:hypothetical protein